MAQWQQADTLVFGISGFPPLSMPRRPACPQTRQHTVIACVKMSQRPMHCLDPAGAIQKSEARVVLGLLVEGSSAEVGLGAGSALNSGSVKLARSLAAVQQNLQTMEFGQLPMLFKFVAPTINLPLAKELIQDQDSRVPQQRSSNGQSLALALVWLQHQKPILKRGFGRCLSFRFLRVTGTSRGTSLGLRS